MFCPVYPTQVLTPIIAQVRTMDLLCQSPTYISLQHIHKIQLQKSLGRLLRARHVIALRVPCRQTVNQGVSFKSCLEGNAEGKMPAISTSVTALSIMTVHALIDIQPAKNVI